MKTSDVMSVFRQIIEAIARIDKRGSVKIEYVAQDLGVEIVDMRLWLLLMDSMRVVTIDSINDYVVLNLINLDWLGFDIDRLVAE